MSLKDLDTMKKSDLLKLAKKLKLKGFSRLTKAELIENVTEFVSKGGEQLLDKAKELVETLIKPVPRSTRRRRATTGTSPKRATASQETGKKKAAAKKRKQATPSMKVIEARGLPTPDNDSLAPESAPSAEEVARERIEKMRYEGDTLVQNGKVITPEELRKIDEDLPELPLGYGDGLIHLMPRDPRWLLCYWDIAEEARAHAGKYNGGTLILKLHDITHINFNGHNAWSTHRFNLNEEARYWYIPVPSEGRRFMAELGYAMPDGGFNSLGTSDGIMPPPGSPSPWTHDVFITLPFGEPLSISATGLETSWLGPDLPAQAQYEGAPSIPVMGTPTNPEPWFALEGSVTSPGGNTVSSFVSIKNERGDKERFPLTVDGNLKVFGATKPSASLTIDGKETKVNKDGTFSLTLPLPSKNVSHKVTATGESGERYSITISIERV